MSIPAKSDHASRGDLPTEANIVHEDAKWFNVLINQNVKF